MRLGGASPGGIALWKTIPIVSATAPAPGAPHRKAAEPAAVTGVQETIHALRLLPRSAFAPRTGIGAGTAKAAAPA